MKHEGLKKNIAKIPTELFTLPDVADLQVVLVFVITIMTSGEKIVIARKLNKLI